MEAYKVENFSFKYPGCEREVLRNISFSIGVGEFVLVLGKTGCGKTTLLRNLKPTVAPAGKRDGSISFFGEGISCADEKRLIKSIGFVFQNPSSQIVCDSALDEMCFAAENLGMPSELIKRRMAEICTLFSTSELLDKKTDELSGGEKQMLNLMSVLMTKPEVIILDEPLAQLDPACAENFLRALHKLCKDFGTSIIISEHNSQGLFALADKVLVIEDGTVGFFGEAGQAASYLSEKGGSLSEYLPVSARLCEKLAAPPAFTCAEARAVYRDNKERISVKPEKREELCTQTILRAKNLVFRFEKRGRNILNGLSLDIKRGCALGLVGANGAGKSTLLSVLSGCLKAQEGKVKNDGAKVCLLPQNPDYTFLADSVRRDIDLTLKVNKKDESDLAELTERFQIFEGFEKLYDRNPLDLSAGQKQKLTLLKVLIADGDVILMDECEKGLDAQAKRELGEVIACLKRDGKAIVFISHNPSFVYENADETALIFAGEVIARQPTREFFCGNEIYTTPMGQISLDITESAFTLEEVCVSE